MLKGRDRKAMVKSLVKGGFTVVNEDAKKSHLEFTVTKGDVTITGIVAYTKYIDGSARDAKKAYEYAVANGETEVNFGYLKAKNLV